MTNQQAKADMPRALYSVGDIVAEKCVSAKKLVPLRVISIVRPKVHKNGKVYDGYHYHLEVALPEDGDFYLNGRVFPEGLLIKFSKEIKDYMLGAIYSRIEDLNELVCY